MKKTARKPQIREVKNDCNWFDTENARLIILCALFGFVGAHKFAAGKKGQGWCFILLDLTIVGIVISAIWAFFNLLFLTIKKDNKPGNMILGSVFLLFGMILPLTISCSTSEPTVVEVGKVSKSKEHLFWKGNLKCETSNPLAYTKSMDVFVKLHNSKATLNLEKNTVLMSLKETGEDSWNYIGTNDGDSVGLVVGIENGKVRTPNPKYDYDSTFLLYFAPKDADALKITYNCVVK